MILKIYRIIHILWTGVFALFVSIPILEHGSLEIEYYVDIFFIALWLIGVIFLFIKRLGKYGYILTIMPLLYAVILYLI
ncbi:hypothetical protein SAMN05880501_1102 [Ureibacillus xyleni]|uniref:Uncharacterized protein n=1 Tax=Ureibacillus xyleni TaxID=614648 RepID=A0A285T8V9_9BACL|nr:hypothetical protein SAMN05880501_1102 [Ureibacillus xyleni]